MLYNLSAFFTAKPPKSLLKNVQTSNPSFSQFMIFEIALPNLEKFYVVVFENH
jgi:hypothetical protein